MLRRGTNAASIGVVGCGAIGRALVLESQSGGIPPIAGVTSRNEEKARGFLAQLRNPPPYLDTEELIDRSSLVVEAAGGGTSSPVSRRRYSTPGRT